MPRSKSKRSSYIPPSKPKPPPSPRWVPMVGTGLIALGILGILFNYVFPGILPGGNWIIIVGFAVMAGGLIILSRWR